MGGIEFRGISIAFVNTTATDFEDTGFCLLPSSVIVVCIFVAVVTPHDKCICLCAST